MVDFSVVGIIFYFVEIFEMLRVSDIMWGEKIRFSFAENKGTKIKENIANKKKQKEKQPTNGNLPNK